MLDGRRGETIHQERVAQNPIRITAVDVVRMQAVEPISILFQVDFVLSSLNFLYLGDIVVGRLFLFEAVDLLDCGSDEFIDAIGRAAE